VKREWIFHAAVLFSLVAHGVLLAFKAGAEGDSIARIVRIPVMLEAEPPQPEPPQPKPEPPPKKVRPKNLSRAIAKVTKEGDGLRTSDLVEAEVGDYAEEAEPPPPPAPLPPPLKLKPKQEVPEVVDKVALTREYLALLRDKLATTKKYPLAAQRMGITGSVTVSFIVAPDSRFSNVVIRKSSGHGLLDNAAKAAVEDMSGKLPRPRVLGEIELKTSVVLRYELNG
jgi:protein TonB